MASEAPRRGAFGRSAGSLCVRGAPRIGMTGMRAGPRGGGEQSEGGVYFRASSHPGSSAAVPAARQGERDCGRSLGPEPWAGRALLVAHVDRPAPGLRSCSRSAVGSPEWSVALTKTIIRGVCRYDRSGLCER